MNQGDILKDAEKLSHHSLESFIIELTQDPSVFEYSAILAHPQIKTISKEYVELIQLFSYGTLETLKKTYKGVKLNEKQNEQLKRLTILSIFEGQQVFIFQKIGYETISTGIENRRIQACYFQTIS